MDYTMDKIEYIIPDITTITVYQSHDFSAYSSGQEIDSSIILVRQLGFSTFQNHPLDMIQLP